jgi:nitrite reductase (NO-forming)
MATSTAPRKQSDREAFLWVGVGFIAFLAFALSIAGFFFPSRSSTVTTQARVGAGTGTQRIAVFLTEFAVKPSTVEVDPGKNLELEVTNAGTMAHDLKLNGTIGTRLLQPGRSQVVSVGVVDTETLAWCTVPGHRQAGMVLHVVIKGGSAAVGSQAAVAAPATASVSGMAMAGMTPAVATGPADATIDFSATPGKDWKPFDPTLAPAPGGTEHKVTFHATEKLIEVAPGVHQEMWTFNDQVPGPVLRGRVGDLFTVTLVNDGKIEHSIDFHASKVAWNDKMRSIKPGESLVYQYQAKFAGVFMYHCGTAPALHHIGNGMYGAVVIDPPTLAPVDHEYLIVQSELYTGPEGQPGDLAKMQKEAFDAVVFNGFVNQYKFSPIRVEPNQRVRVWVLDAGPSENSSFHIVGTIFDTVFKEGTYLLQPDTRRGGSQALDLQPAQGGFVEFSFDEAGLYPIVTHKFSNVGKGALGLFQAGEVKAAVPVGH